MKASQWITANTGSLIAGAIVVLLLIILLRSTVRSKKNGNCGCGCGCSHCSGSCPHFYHKAHWKHITKEVLYHIMKNGSVLHIKCDTGPPFLAVYLLSLKNFAVRLMISTDTAMPINITTGRAHAGLAAINPSAYPEGISSMAHSYV